MSGFNYESFQVANGQGVELGSMLNGSRQLYNFPALRIDRSVVRAELLRLTRKEGIPVFWGRKCTGIVSEKKKKAAAFFEEESSEGSATVEFADGETVSADFVVAADGIHSKVRPFVATNHAQDLVFTGLIGIMGTMKADELGGLAESCGLRFPCMLFGANGAIGVLPSSFDGKDIGWFANVEAEDRSRDEWTKFGNDGQGMKDLLIQQFLNSRNTGTAHLPELVEQLLLKTPPETLTNWP